MRVTKKLAAYLGGLILCAGTGLVILGCGPSIRTTYSNITSTPAGAKVYFGTSADSISHYLGITPYSDSNTGENPSWKAGYYKVVKDGYKPEVQYAPLEYGNRYMNFVLQPMPDFPTPPRISYPDANTVAVTPLNLEANRHPKLKIKPTDTIAIMNFKEPEGSGAGSLVADSIILGLQIKGYNVIDREQIEKLMREQGLLADGRTNLTDLEVSKRIGKLIQADYIIYGAITDYSAKSENVQLSPVLESDDMARYQREYDAYMNFYAGQDDMKMSRVPKTIQEWELDYSRSPKSSYITIARVGVTAKMVDIRSSNIVWVGIANLSDLRLQQGMKRIVAGMIDDFTAQPTAP